MKVTLEDTMGTDVTVVNAARVSFSKRSHFVGMEDYVQGCVPSYSPRQDVVYLSEGDARLIEFLARGCTSQTWEALIGEIAHAGHDHHLFQTEETREELLTMLREFRTQPTHWTPFGHCMATFVIKAPIFVARQLFKHKVGSVENEVSRRYVVTEPEVWVPEEWREAVADKKQGSGGAFKRQNEATYDYRQATRVAVNVYNLMIEAGVCPEQARAVLPQGTYTEWWVTGSLFYWANLYRLRTGSHAQKETAWIAHQIGDALRPLFPVSWKALTG